MATINLFTSQTETKSKFFLMVVVSTSIKQEPQQKQHTLMVLLYTNSNQVKLKNTTLKTKQIIYPDGTIRYLLSDGFEETHYPNGTIKKTKPNNISTN